MAKVCRMCRKPVHFEHHKGYIHDGGGMYMMKCRDCGEKFSPAKLTVNCPKCNSRNVVDDHCVYAVDSEALDVMECIEKVARRSEP